LEQALEMLRRRGRVSYRALQVQFQLDDTLLEILKDEIVAVHQLARDQEGKMLVWTGDTCPPQKYGLRSPSSFCETVTIVQTAQIENSSAEMIRYYLSLIPEAFKFVWAHVNVAENTPQSSNFERTVAMHWN